MIWTQNDAQELLIYTQNHYYRYAHPLIKRNANNAGVCANIASRKGTFLFYDNDQVRVSWVIFENLNDLCYEILFLFSNSSVLLPKDNYYLNISLLLAGKVFNNENTVQNVFQEFINSKTLEFYACLHKYSRFTWSKMNRM